MSKNEFDEKKYIDGLVQNGLTSLGEYKNLNQEQIDFIVKKATVAAIDAHGWLAKMAVEETGRGVFEDKATKNMFAAEFIQNSMKKMKTVGIISEDKDSGIVQIAEPVGVVAGLTPTTNPTSTVIFKALISIKTRNPIIFAFHPSAQKCSLAAAKVILDAAVEAGAPANCVQWVEFPSLGCTNELMNHDGIATILATGGNAMVKAAYSCGKPALGVGAGNVPAYFEKTCNVKQACYDVVLSKAFDNGMICASEQAVIIDKEIYNEVVEEFKSFKVHFATADEKAKLESFMFGCKANSKNCAGAALNSAVVGKPAPWIAEQAGFSIDPECVIICAEVSSVGEKEPLTREKLSPVLAVLKSNSTQEGISLAAQMVEFNGLGHSAAVHTRDEQISKDFGAAVKAIRVIWNSPSTFGGIGDVYNSFIPSLTLGCGSYGRNSVSGNVGAFNLLNIKSIGERRTNMQWFKIPSKIYFEPNSIQYLRDMKGMSRVMIVADKTMEHLGHVQTVIDQLHARKETVQIDLFLDVEPDPDITTVYRGRDAMNSFEPDTIIAIGGGSVMDAAKIMWFFYEKPEADFNDLYQKFIDIRKRAFKYGELGGKSQFVAVPTTSGTGSEVTPFAVISDKANNKKYPLADYALTPTVAILDPNFVLKLPANIAAMTGMDVLTHALESYVSILANDLTDGMSLHALKLVFDYLPKSVSDSDVVAREKMHNASTLAGMSFANSFLGINHSLAHKLGGEYHIAHGLANSILLPYVIKYNGQKPQKLALWPKYNEYVADEKYQNVARLLGLKADTPAEGVDALAQACRDLAVEIKCPTSFKELGIDEKDFLSKVPALAELAFEDQCTPANPRLAMCKDMEKILIDAYYGNDFK